MQYNPTHFPKARRWRVNLLGGQVITTSETTIDLGGMWENAEKYNFPVIKINDLSLRPAHISAVYPLHEQGGDHVE